MLYIEFELPLCGHVKVVDCHASSQDALNYTFVVGQRALPRKPRFGCMAFMSRALALVIGIECVLAVSMAFVVAP